MLIYSSANPKSNLQKYKMENIIDPNLFISTDYVNYPFQYKDIKETILHGSVACTDHDLTGQVIWPSSEALSRYIIDNRQQFKNKNILELGAGAGLAGIVAANFGKKVILTDGIQIVVDLLKLNAQKSVHVDNLQVQFFDWKQHQKFFEAKDRSDIDYLIGADIVFWPQSMEPLCQVIDRFLKYNGAKCIIAVKNRSNTSQKQFQSYLQKYNLQRKTIAKEDNHISVYSVQRKNTDSSKE